MSECLLLSQRFDVDDGNLKVTETVVYVGKLVEIKKNM